MVLLYSYGKGYGNEKASRAKTGTVGVLTSVRREASEDVKKRMYGEKLCGWCGV